MKADKKSGIRRICYWVFHRLMGWKAVVTVPDFEKSIICVAPHTSNRDLFVGKLFIAAVGRKAGFVMKKEWFVGPLGWFFRKMGGIPVHRGKGTSLIGEVVEIANRSEVFHLAITPEGTRAANPKWHLGFYVIASQARLPIVLMAMDYERKEVRMEKYLWPSNDRKGDIRTILTYFKEVRGKYPKKFLTGLE